MTLKQEIVSTLKNANIKLSGYSRKQAQATRGFGRTDGVYVEAFSDGVELRLVGNSVDFSDVVDALRAENYVFSHITEHTCGLVAKLVK